MSKIKKRSAIFFACMMLLASVPAAAAETQTPAGTSPESATAGTQAVTATEIDDEGDESDYTDRYISTESRTETVNAAYCGIRVFIDGKELIPQDVSGKATEPFILSGTTYLPARAVSGALGLNVDWDQKTKTVILSSGGSKNFGTGQRASTVARKAENVTYPGVRIKINEVEILPCDVNGNVAEPFILRGTTYLPLRAVSGALGLSAEWDGANKTVKLSSGVAVQKILAEEAVRSDGELRALQLNTFKADGKNAMTRSYDLKDGALSYEFIEYKYGKDGQLIQEVAIDHNGEKNETGYIYDSAGRVSLERTTQYDGSISEIAYTWNEKGLLTATKETAKGETITSEYTYDDNGNQKSFRQEGAGAWEQLVNEYDAAGLLVKQTRTGSEYAKPVVTVYKYENGVLVSDEETGANGTVTNKWNGEEMLISSTSVEKDQNGVAYSSTEKNTYDESGRLTTTVIETKDGADSAIYTITYSYATDGTLISSKMNTVTKANGAETQENLITSYRYQVIPA